VREDIGTILLASRLMHEENSPNKYIISHLFLRGKLRLLMFSKMLKRVGKLSVREAGKVISTLGFDGVDLTVRENGYVEPGEAEEKLGSAIMSFREFGLIVPMITTNFTSSRDRFVEEVFRTASENGVKYIKLGYWHYRKYGELRSLMREAERGLKGIYELCKEYDVVAGIHTHSGRYLNAFPGLIFNLLRNFEPEYVCSYIDPGHIAGWGGVDMIEPYIELHSEYIRMVAVKNFVMEFKGGRWERSMRPLEEEVVPWRDIFKALRRIEFDEIVSLHSEYKQYNYKELIEQTRRDLSYIRRVIKEVWED